ncbi:MAG: hypothetical protein HKUEN02_15390 [Anaerolineaceae bacterium]|nr:MAG: hypothetical protein HKUEN02_15390 [Anaerolineaceae bacterium]
MEICYLIVFPDSETRLAPIKEPIKGLKDAPYFQPVDIDLVPLGEEVFLFEGYSINIMRHRYDDYAQMIECRYQISDPFALPVLQTRASVQSALQKRYVPQEHLQSGMYEEYSILLTQDAPPTPDEWIEKNALGLANFIRSQRDRFDSAEIDEILSSRMRYSAEELTLVDWEGALIVAPNADYRSDIVLLKIGNYQLLRYRMLDQSIEDLLDKINDSFFRNRRRPRATRGLIRQIAEHKLEVMLDFERVEQNILLIGDWYTAKLYAAIQSELYLDEWKDNVRAKLDNLESIMQTIRDNLAISWENLLDQLQLVLWLAMLFGYLYLYLLDAGFIVLTKR